MVIALIAIILSVEVAIIILVAMAIYITARVVIIVTAVIAVTAILFAATSISTAINIARRTTDYYSANSWINVVRLTANNCCYWVAVSYNRGCA